MSEVNITACGRFPLSTAHHSHPSFSWLIFPQPVPHGVSVVQQEDVNTHKKNESVPIYPRKCLRHPENVFWFMGPSCDSLEHVVTFWGCSMGGLKEMAKSWPTAAYG